MKTLRTTIILAAVWSAILGAAMVQAGEIRISAAASMTNLLNELIETFRSQHPDTTVVANFGSSGALAKQIEQGAPADLFISANTKWMTYLADQQLIDVTTKAIFAYNSLVFVGKADTAVGSLADLGKLSRIGIGTPKSVPAGQYAEQALRKAGIYEQLARESRLVMAKDVRQALIYADRGETEGSFVYRTDALLATSATILFTVPQDLYDRVAYPLALTSTGTANPEARTFQAFVIGEQARRIIANHGFEIPSE